MSAGTPLRTSQKLKLYGVLTKTIGTFAGRVLRPIDVGRQPHAVLHRDHHPAFDDGDLLELGFEVAALLISAGVRVPCCAERTDVARTTAVNHRGRREHREIMIKLP